MPSVTIHDLPPQLYERLKESAERNRQSLDAEIIEALDYALPPAGRPSTEEIRRRADESRRRLEELGITFTDDEEVTRYKNMGRR
jgi:plasmid stability protein